MLLTLQQKIKNDLLPDFSELLLQLRTEEERRSIKMDRMQRHFGSSKVKHTMHFQYVAEADPKDELNTDILQKYITETESLRKQVSELQIQLTEKRAQRRKNMNKRQLQFLCHRQQQLTSKFTSKLQDLNQNHGFISNVEKKATLPSSVKTLPTKTWLTRSIKN